MTLDKDTRRIIRNLKGNPDFEFFLGWLKREHAKTCLDATHGIGEERTMLCGQAQALEMEIARITDAYEIEKVHDMEVLI